MRKLFSQLHQLAFRIRNRIAISNRAYEKIVEQVNAVGAEFAALNDDDLMAAAELAQARYADEPSTVHKVGLMAIAREAAERAVGLRPYDVQLVAALALADRKCVEMYTGEGKTLAAAVTVCLKAATRESVHVLTFNDYLAKRDADWMGPLFRFFGLTVGFVQEGMPENQRRLAYGCDVTYVTGKEAGFDFLRDQNCENLTDRVQRGHHFAIIDEADSTLIDEARIPHVLAAEDTADGFDLFEFANIVRGLHPVRDHQVQNGGRNCSFTEAGIARLESMLDCGELHSEQNVDLLSRLNVALHAELLLKRDIDYIVRGDMIELIDEFTGRVADNRRWPGGIQAAIEAKESVAIQPQGVILNSITMQYFLEQYDELAGMSGTAQESTGELDEFYDLKVVVVPPNLPCIRVDHPDRVFSTQARKESAVVDEIQREHLRRRPVLVGTASVEESTKLAGLLQSEGVDCRVLNAANDHQEAEIVADAGALGAVTISTNMAGRGTDIKLGGHDERDRDTVVQLGGLYVIGTNRHESRRIDNQLRGRAGRQGDPGESRFFVSLEDDLLVRFGLASSLADAGDDERINDTEIDKSIAHLQRVVEGESFSIRRMLRKYAFLLERQRRKVADDRDELIKPDIIPQYLRDAEPEYYGRLTEHWGVPHIADIERRVAVRHIGRLWSQHLEHAAQVRENIHLVSLGGFDAFDAFNREMNNELRSFEAAVREGIVETMKTATITADGIDLDREGLSAPASTWTYMINDNPKGGVLDQLTRGVVRMVKGWLRGGR